MSDLRDRVQRTLGEGYRVTNELGGGGMSRVFVAEETGLDRKVVVKVLPPDLAAGLNVERFRREIQLAARLQHPHIVPVLSAGAKEGVLYYTMPLIAGETLRSRLARSGELPVAEAVRILRDVADAIDYAHRQGVVHRDIKPDNILLSDHHALVMDFGVSKALTSATGETNLTSIGVALGTPAYMSPEQATADPHIDHRTDIYALGILGYELLAGRPPFSGHTSQHVLAAQVTEKPVPLTQHRPAVPANLATLVMRCLEKRPADRWQSAREVLDQIESLSTPSGGLSPVTRPGLRETWRRHPLLSAIAAAAAVAVAGGAIVGITGAIRDLMGSGDEPPFAIGQTRQITNTPGIEITPALSPDGKLLAYAAGDPGTTRIYVRQLAGGKPIAVAENPSGDQRAPQWSPDGSRIAFIGRDGAYIVPSLGGSAKRVFDAPQTPAAGGPPSLGGVAWSPDGQTLAVADGHSSVYAISSDGTQRRKIADGRYPHSPAWSRDGSRIAYVTDNPVFVFGRSGRFGNRSPTSIWVARVNAGTPTRVTTAIHLNTSPSWTADDRAILYVSTLRGGRDVYSQRLRRDGRPVGEPQRLTTGLNAHSIDISADGRSAVYSAWTSSSTLWWMPLPASGTTTVRNAHQLTFANELIEVPGLSSDGEWAAFDSDRGGNADIWKVRIAGGEPEQLTRDPADEFNPNWSPDGRVIAFHSWRSGSRDLLLMNSDGSGIRNLVATPAHEIAGGWSPDGKFVAFLSDRNGRSEVYLVPRDGGPPRQITTTGADLFLRTAWSFDAKWIAYARAGEVWIVAPSGSPGRAIATSSSLGGHVATDIGGWSKDSRWVLFRAQDADGRKHIWAASPYGEKPRAVVVFDQPDRQSYQDQFTTEGSKLVFTIGKHEADIWVMELQKK